MSDPEHPIEPVRVNGAALRSFTSEDQFTGLAVDLTREAGSVLAIGACAGHRGATPTSFKSWPRERAVPSGLLVRLTKLFHGLLGATCKLQGELMCMFARPTFETSVNLMYVVERWSPDLIERFIRYSLVSEKRLLDLIDKNIANRGGQVLPIEGRMRRSILRAFEVSGVDPTTSSKADKQGFGGNLLDRARELGLDGGYLAMFSLPSHAIHGNWEDLFEHHLQRVEGGFIPDPRWTRPRPQLLIACSGLSIEAERRYLQWEFGEDAAEALSKIEDLSSRLDQFSTHLDAFHSRSGSMPRRKVEEGGPT